MTGDAAVWFVIIEGQQSGPMSRAEVGLEWATGTIAGGNLVWKQGMRGWLPAAEVPELSSIFQPPPPKPTPPPPAAPPTKPPPLPTRDEPAEGGDWADRTQVEMLPFGERVHQEQVGAELFDANGEVTQSTPGLDLSKWAAKELGKKRIVSPPPQTARPATATAPRPRQPARLTATLLVGALILAAVLSAFVVFLLG
jgi:hypothetical protein